MTLDNFSLVLKVLQQRQGSMPFLCRDRDLCHFPSFSKPIEDATEVAQFVQSELLRLEDKLRTLSEFGMTAWIDDDFGAFYLELELSESYILKCSKIEMIVAKVFMDNILWCILYYQGKYIVTLNDAAGEHELLDTNFPKVNNPHKKFLLSEYKKLERWVKMSMLYSPLSGAGAKKTTDLEALESDSSGDEDLTNGSDFLVDTSMNDIHAQENLFREGYHQTYFVRKPSRTTTRRKVFVRCGNWCYDGEVDLGQVSLVLSDIPMAIPILQAQQSSLRYVNEFNNLRRSNPYRKALLHLSHAAAFMEEKATSPAAVRALEQLEELASGNDVKDPGQKIHAGEAVSEYFELQLSQNSTAYDDIELAACKIYVRGVIIVMIYFDGSIYATLADGEGDQPLLDVAFPDMSRKGGGCQIGTYDHPLFCSLCIWQGVPTSQVSALKADDGIKYTESHIVKQKSSLKFKAAAKETTNLISNGGQTYIVFKHGSLVSPVSKHARVNIADAKSPREREAFFRFGSWCYCGTINFEIDPGQMTLEKVHTVLPSIATQQEKMSFSTELETLSDRSKASQVLLRLETAANFIVEQMVNATAEIEQLKKLLVHKGQKPWIDDSTRNVYFELQLSDDGAAPMEEVETICSKVYIKGILLTMIYVSKNIYIILDEGEGEHALLDSSFPDISIKSRGFTLGCKTHEYFKKFSVWEGSIAVMEPASVKSELQRISVKSYEGRNENNVAKSMKDFGIAGSKVSQREGRDEENQQNGRIVLAPNKIQSTHHTSSMKKEPIGISKVKPPHRLAPLQINRSSLAAFSGLKPLGKTDAESPWDQFGKPRATGTLNRKK